MTQTVKSTLFLPFEKGEIDVPEAGETALFLGAETHPFLREFARIDCCQFWRAPAKAMEAAGYHAAQTFPPPERQGTYAAVLCLLPKQKEEAQAFLGQGALALSDSGILVAAAANDAGGGRIEKWFREMGFSSVRYLSKHKARVVWAQKDFLEKGETAQKWAAQGQLQQIAIEGETCFSQPGLFGWNRIDEGSKILKDYLPDNLSGVGADFGCGYGYLARQVLTKNPGIGRLYALDADARAVQAAQRNLEGFPVEAKWEDLTTPVSTLPLLDFIVMNPPFHAGKKTDQDTGQAFIRTARTALKAGGRLFMVANAHLSYERCLEDMFSDVQKHAEKSGFKIFEACV
ncbi:MAG: methyltransferase [Rhodospirillales bacterium]|nr:methyltransferase [Alphaproteobacteria bacterium]USO04188.1 MAG: methyltransferase [Rhodospirillales bacterium]